MNRHILFILLMCFCNNVQAQLDLSAGPQTGYPLLFNGLNKAGYTQSVSVGFGATVAYKFGNSYFYPALSASVSALTLPVARSDGFVWSNEFTKRDVMLNLKHGSLLNNTEINWYAGIGVAFVSADASSLSATSGNYRGSVSDSSKYETASAAADIGFDFRFRFSQTNPHWLWGADANLQAVYITGEYGHFYINSGNSITRTDINGILLSGTLSVSIIYRIGKTDQ
ncbi:MAG: hypothetical protein JSS96_04710 [Bacteroidetes bacterium]|nr:hypothetical protein [Bacteroidota bacterium]